MVKLTTVLLVRNAYASDFGGGERYSVNLAVELAKSNIRPIIATAHHRIHQLAADQQIAAIPMPWWKFQNFSGWRLVFLILYLSWQIRLIIWYLHAISKYQVDILHLQSRDDFIAGTIAGRLRNRRVIWTDHADLKYIFQNTSQGLRNPIGHIVKFLSRKAHRVIIVSNNELQLIKNSVGQLAGNYQVIYNGITNQKIQPTRTLPRTDTVFVATSRLVGSKGLRELINATNKLCIKGLRVKTLLLGEGPEKNQLMEMAGDSVIFAGYPGNSLELVAGADVFVHPSYNEGFSLSLVEAAMLGKPVIATAVGGNLEMITNNKTGLLVRPRDEDDLAKAMHYAIEHHQKMLAYGQSLNSYYLRNLQFDQIVQRQLIPIYND